MTLTSTSHHGLAGSFQAAEQPRPSALLYLPPHHGPLQSSPVLKRMASSLSPSQKKNLPPCLVLLKDPTNRPGKTPPGEAQHPNPRRGPPRGSAPAASPHLHHLLADVNDAEPVQQLGEALQLGIALLQGHLPLAGQLPAEVLDQLALEEKKKVLWDPLPSACAAPPAPKPTHHPPLPAAKLLQPRAPLASSWVAKGGIFPPKKSPFSAPFIPIPEVFSAEVLLRGPHSR